MVTWKGMLDLERLQKFERLSCMQIGDATDVCHLSWLEEKKCEVDFEVKREMCDDEEVKRRMWEVE